MGGKENYIYQLTNKSCFSRWGNLNPLLPFESLQILNHHHQHHHHHGGKHSYRRYSFRPFFCNSFNSQISQCSTFSGFVLVCWSWFFCSVSCFVYIFRVLCVKVLWFSQWKEIQKKKKRYIKYPQFPHLSSLGSPVRWCCSIVCCKSVQCGSVSCSFATNAFAALSYRMSMKLLFCGLYCR